MIHITNGAVVGVGGLSTLPLNFRLSGKCSTKSASCPKNFVLPTMQSLQLHLETLNSTVYGAVIVALQLSEFTRFIWWICTTSTGWLPTSGPSQSAWATDLPRLTAMWLHSPLPFITTQPENWYSFDHPTKGRRLSQPSWLVTYWNGLNVCRLSPTDSS